MTPNEPRKTKAQASRESREAILRAGTELLAEETQRNPFSAITMRELCGRAGRSTGTFYAHWKDADEFQRELATHLMEDALLEDFGELMAVATEVSEQPGSAAILRLAERDIATLMTNSVWDAIELLNVTWARTILRDPAIQGYRAVDQLTGETYDIILKRLGREPRPPLTLTQIGTILQALVEGFAFRTKIDPAGTRVADAPSSHLYALAVASVLTVTTRSPGDNDSLRDALESTLSP